MPQSSSPFLWQPMSPVSYVSFPEMFYPHARNAYPSIHTYMHIYTHLYMNSPTSHTNIGYCALFFFHLVYLRYHSKSVPKELSQSFILLDIIPGCRCLLNWVPTNSHLHYSQSFFVINRAAFNHLLCVSL